LVTADEIPDPGALDLRIAVNGEERQHSNTRYLILGVAELIEYASSFYTLHPGDVIITGTPEGVSPIQPGDVVSASIERIGTMDAANEAAKAAEQKNTEAIFDAGTKVYRACTGCHLQYINPSRSRPPAHQ